MKKYLMSGVAAIAFLAAFTSCSKSTDLYDQGAVDEKNRQEQEKKDQQKVENVQAAYEKAFQNAFGQPAAGQDWGFGDDNASTRALTRGFTRAIQPSFDFPNDADASKFLNDVPEGVEKLTENKGTVNNYIDETWEGDLNIWSYGAGKLYIKGNCDFSNRSFYFGGNSELYLVKGATLTLGENNGSKNLQSNTMIYIAEGAKLVANGELMLNNGLHIYNHGTIETPKLSTNSNSVLYNTGTVTVTDRISVENTLSVIVNDGKITAADLNTAGSGKFENNNKVTISGTTFVNSNSNTWVNNGQYHTGNFIYYAASDEVINNCKLTVDEDFGINLADNDGSGNFKMDAGSSVVTKNFYGGGNWSGTYAGTWCNAQGGPFYIYMGAGSVFKVTETATMNASKENYGIYGPTDGSSYDGVSYAVFEAKNVVMGKENQGFEVTYGGNLAVVAESHFANGNDGREDHPFIDIKGNAKIYAPEFESGKPNITIEETECNPGFEGDETLTEVRVICEDLFANSGSDFDFNDLVFDVVFGTNAKIIIRAAGGTLPIYINNGTEIHKLMGNDTPDEKGLLPMLNTGAAAKGLYGVDNVAAKEIELGIAINKRKEIPEKITIKVVKDGTEYTLQNNKEAATMICVGTDFTPWMGERDQLKLAYPKFVDFVQTGKPAWNKWYK